MTQLELASLIPCSQSLLSRIENGDHVPAKDLLEKIVHALHLEGTFFESLHTERGDLTRRIDEEFGILPVARPDHLFGREAEVSRLEEVVSLRGQHVVMHGPRGVGKTSIVKTVAAHPPRDARWVYEHCSSDDLTEFRQVWQAVLSKLGVPVTQIEMGPREVARRLCEIQSEIVVVIDEIDALSPGQHEAFLSMTSRLAKRLCDEGADVTLVLVSPSGPVIDEMIENDALSRTVQSLPVAPLTKEAVEVYLQQKSRRLGLDFAEDLREALGWISGGMPFFLQAACRLACRAAARRRTSGEVNLPDLESSATDLISDVAMQIPRRDREILARLNDFQQKALVSAASLWGGDEGTRERVKDLRCSWEWFSAQDVARRMRWAGLNTSTTVGKLPGDVLSVLEDADFFEHARSPHGMTFRLKNQRLRPFLLVWGWVEHSVVPFGRCLRCGQSWIDLQLAERAARRKHALSCNEEDPDMGGGS